MTLFEDSDNAVATAPAPLLRVDNLVVEYAGRGWKKPPFRALQGVSVDVPQGKTLGLVGESGSGKSTLGRAVLGLAPISHGSVTFAGRDITQLGPRDRRELSADIQVVFQDPYSSLNPAMTIDDILSEPLLVAGTSRSDAMRRVRNLLDQVHLPSDAGRRLPREFSGGQRQRVAIARALCREPKLIVCDEPVSALDLSTQARVMDLFVEIQRNTGVAYLFITHDLSVVRYISHEVAVMRAGQIVESGDAAMVTSSPSHEYTQQLLLAAPVSNPDGQRRRRQERDLLLAARRATEVQNEDAGTANPFTTSVRAVRRKSL